MGKVLVNLCERLVAQHMGLPSLVCVHSEICGKGDALEHDGEPGLNYLCAGLKRSFAHAVPTAERMAVRLRGRPDTQP